MSDTTPIPPASERELPEDKNFPFYELRFIMRVLSHEGDAPREDWKTARGMAREIFVRWRKAQPPFAALSHPSTPQGWKLVPVEPVLVMLQAGRDLDLEGPGNGWLTNLPHYELRDIWQAMLNAAPLPPEQGGTA